jgi:predicted house-cleaning NTP pyrophosphatase (Maf/HAM1 superfamily)
MSKKDTPTALAPSDAAALLTKMGMGEIDAEMIEDDIHDGAPTNKDGTINLFHYAAWLVLDAKGNRGK